MTEHGAIGHNSVAGSRLRAFIERLERLDDEKREIAEQFKEVCAEAKAEGYDTKTIRRVLRERKKSAERRQEEEAMFDLYWHAAVEAVFEG